jgi:hypothetical protein
MKTSSPVDGDVAFATVQTSCPLHASTSANTAELKKTVEDRAIITDIVLSLLLCESIHVVGSDFLEEVNVFVSVELGHFMTGSWFCALSKSQPKIMARIEEWSHKAEEEL